MTTITAVAPLFGRWCVISVTSYGLDGQFTLTYGLRAAALSEAGDDPLAATPAGVLRLPAGDSPSRRSVEQTLVVRPVSGVAVEAMVIGDDATVAARMMAREILRLIEGLADAVRFSIRRNLARSLLPAATDLLDSRYGRATREAAQALAGQANWSLLLEPAGGDEACLRTVDYILTHNAVRVNAASHDGPSELDRYVPGDADLRETLVNARAEALVRRVCGAAALAELRQCGRITVASQGYVFSLSPRRLTRCRDSAGRKATLCIHTYGLSCNPLDEVVIAWLWIRYRLDEYFATANVLAHEPGFALPSRRRAPAPVQAPVQARWDEIPDEIPF